MYIIELIVKLLKEKKRGASMKVSTPDYEECEHVFLPIDSTEKILACTKCGYLIKAEELKVKTKNPFED